MVMLARPRTLPRAGVGVPLGYLVLALWVTGRGGELGAARTDPSRRERFISHPDSEDQLT